MSTPNIQDIYRLLDDAFIEETQRVPTYSAREYLTKVSSVLGKPLTEPLTEEQAQWSLDELHRVVDSPERRAVRMFKGLYRISHPDEDPSNAPDVVVVHGTVSPIDDQTQHD